MKRGIIMRFFNKLVEKIMGSLEKIDKFTENRYIKAIAGAMTAFVPFTVITGIAYIIAFFPVPGFENFITKIGGSLFDYASFCAYFTDFGNATMNLGALIVCVYLAYKLAQSYKSILAINAGVLAMAIYIFASPIATAGIGVFGTGNVFAGMIIAVLSTELYRFFVEHKVTIKMPPQVPENVASSFTSLIPMGIVMVIFSIIKLLCMLTPWGNMFDLINGLIAQPFAKVSTSIYGFMLMHALVLILWFFGLHGNNILWSLITPALIMNTDANRLAMLSGEPLPYILTNEFASFAYANVAMWTCITILIFCKSARLKATGKVAIIPSIFRIDEPTNFGLPVMLNPIMWIPYFLCNMLGVLLTYIMTVIGVLPRLSGVAVTWTMPTVLSGFLMTNGNVIAAIWQVLLGLMYMAIQFPFLKVYDKQILAQEAVAGEDEDD